MTSLTSTRNAMQVEFSEDLKLILEKDGSGLQIQAQYLPEAEIEKRYLNRPYGNAYDFDQKDHIENGF
jgi:hypothetical protein